MTRSAASTKKAEVSVLCRNCTRLEECLKDRSVALFMASTTYCTRFDNVDKTPGLFPFLQPYEAEYRDAEYIYHNSKRYGNGRWQSHVSLTYNGTSGHRYSLVMSESNYTPTFNGDYTQTSTSNELIYIPTKSELEKMQFSNAADRKKFDEWIEKDDYASSHRGQYAERNSNLTPWENQFDFHFAQDFFYKSAES